MIPHHNSQAGTASPTSLLPLPHVTTREVTDGNKVSAGGRVLSPLEIQLFRSLGNERQPIQLARVIGSLPEDADHNVIEQAVVKALPVFWKMQTDARKLTTSGEGGRTDGRKNNDKGILVSPHVGR